VYEAYSPPGGFSLSDYLGALVLTPTSGVTGNKPGNGLASLFLRWALPAAGFETYAEWARDDYSFNWTSMLMEPDHSQAWTIGLQKVVPGRSHWVRIAAEATHLESSQTLRGGRGVVTMYTHSVVIQGHTNGGQMLGAPIGPGSDNQYLGVDVLGSWGTLGGYVERTGYHDDAYFNSYARSYGNSAHDVELTGGLRGSYYLHGVTLRSELGYSYRLDRSFLGLDGVNWNLRHDYNLGVRLGASWWPSLGRGPAAGVVAP